MEIIDQKILHDSVRWPLSPEYGGDPLFKNTRLKKDTIAGDIVVANSAGDKLFVPQNLYAEDKAKWAEKGYEPIAVVVVPASHTDDGTARCASLKYMDCDDPENGTSESSSSQAFPRWGYQGEHVPGVTVVYYMGFEIPGTTTCVMTTPNWYVPSDAIRWNQSDVDDPNNPDPIARKKRATASGNFAISPYGSDGISKNPTYYSQNSAGKLCMNGKEDTKAIIEYANTISTEWQTSQTIDNSKTSLPRGVYPAAFCCYRYCTKGTSSGDWYLPAIGEMGYYLARSNEICEAYIATGVKEYIEGTTTYNTNVITYTTWTGSGIWCSNEFSDSAAFCHYGGSGYETTTNKESRLRTIAFIKI